MGTPPTCMTSGCSRLLSHTGGHGKITSSELRRAVPGSNGSIPDINLWHAINK